MGLNAHRLNLSVLFFFSVSQLLGEIYSRALQPFEGASEVCRCILKTTVPFVKGVPYMALRKEVPAAAQRGGE